MSTQHLTQMRLIAALNHPNVSIISVEGLLQQDARRCFRVLRSLLDVVMQHERGEWSAATETAGRLGLGTFELREAHHRALTWSSQLTLTAAA